MRWHTPYKRQITIKHLRAEQFVLYSSTCSMLKCDGHVHVAYLCAWIFVFSPSIDINNPLAFTPSAADDYRLCGDEQPDGNEESAERAARSTDRPVTRSPRKGVGCNRTMPWGRQFCMRIVWTLPFGQSCDGIVMAVVSFFLLLLLFSFSHLQQTRALNVCVCACVLNSHFGHNSTPLIYYHSHVSCAAPFQTVDRSFLFTNIGVGYCTWKSVMRLDTHLMAHTFSRDKII